MPLQHAYATTNKLTALADAAFTWTPATTTNRVYLHDGRMDKIFSVASTASTVNVVIDFGSATALTAIAILNSNIAQATSPTITIAAADDAAITVNPVTPKATTTLNTTAPRQKDHVLQFASVSKRYWRITWAWTGSFALTLGEIYACVTTALTRYTVFGHSEDEEYFGTEFQSDTGESRGHFIAGPYRTKVLPFEDLSESERDELLTLRRACNAGASPLLWCHQYEAVSTAAAAAYQDVIWGRLRGNKNFPWNEFDYARFNVNALVLKSLAREVGA